MYNLRLIFAMIVLGCAVACMARPASHIQKESRPSIHARTSTRKRHVDVAISHALSKHYQELKRMLILNNLVSSVESGRNYTLQKLRTLTMGTKHAGGRYRPLRIRGIIGAQVMPDKQSIPDQKKISQDLLSRLNGEKVDGRLRVRVVGTRPLTIPRNLREFILMADTLRQEAAATKTCIELQKTIMKLPSIRIKVRCRTQAPRRRVVNGENRRIMGLHRRAAHARHHTTG